MTSFVGTPSCHPLPCVTSFHCATVPLKLMVASDVHPENAFSPIDETLLGMLIPAMDVHPSNALAPMLVSPEGRHVHERIVQFLNAPSPMDVTVCGIYAVVMSEHPLNAPFPIDVLSISTLLDTCSPISLNVYALVTLVLAPSISCPLNVATPASDISVTDVLAVMKYLVMTLLSHSMMSSSVMYDTLLYL